MSPMVSIILREIDEISTQIRQLSQRLEDMTGKGLNVQGTAPKAPAVEWYRISRAAKMLDVSPRTLRSKCSTGVLKPYAKKNGKQWLISSEYIAMYGRMSEK